MNSEPLFSMNTNAVPKGLLADFDKLRDNFKLILTNGIEDFFPNSQFSETDGAYAKFVMEYSLNREERLVILLALLQYLDPSMAKQMMNETNDFHLAQCGKTGILMPTGETFLRLLSNNNVNARIAAHKYLGADHLFYRKSVIDIGETTLGASRFTGVLKLTQTFHDLFLYNKYARPRFSPEFPAHLLETQLEWEDLVINVSTASRLDEIRSYLLHGDVLRKEWGLAKHMKPGYRAIFYGPSGTGKTLAATLLGKYVSKEVYRVDISSVISKYVGETSKNLNSLFNTAEDKDWILFFDEGDALFGKRVDTAQAENKNASFVNQDIAFLLQRIENYNGLVIVASNFRKNIDDAFSRRFQNLVHFDILKPELSIEYWKRNMPSNVKLGAGVNFEMIVKQYPLSPASIINIINRVCLMTIRKESNEITNADLELCIKDELVK